MPNFNNPLWTLFTVFCLSQTLLGYTAVKAKPTRTLPTITSTKTVARVEEPTVSPARLRLAPTWAIQDQTMGYGGLVDLSFSTGSPFFIGVETGYLQWEKNPEIESTPSITIPILISLLYRFDLSRGGVHPYLGTAIGVSLTRDELTSETPDEKLGFETTFQVTARPGVEFDLGKTVAFFIEPQFGLFKSRFLFLPQAGLAFSF